MARRKADILGKGGSLTGSKRPRKPDASPRQQGYATADENDENGRSQKEKIALEKRRKIKERGVVKKAGEELDDGGDGVPDLPDLPGEEEDEEDEYEQSGSSSGSESEEDEPPKKATQNKRQKTTGGSKEIVPFNGVGSSAGTHGSTYLERSAARSMERNYRKSEDGEVEEIGEKAFALVLEKKQARKAGRVEGAKMSVERAFAIVILDERYEGCAMYPNMESVMNERSVFDRRMSRDELIGKKMAAREVYSNEEYSLRLSEHRRCISSARSDRAGKIGARHFFDEYYGCALKNADPAKVEEVREKKLSLKGGKWHTDEETRAPFSSTNFCKIVKSTWRKRDVAVSVTQLVFTVCAVDLWLDGKTLTDKVAKTEMARTATYVKQTLQDARKKGLKVACKVLGTDSSSNVADTAMITLSKGSTSLAGLEEDITNDDAWEGWESVIEPEVTPLAE